MCKNNIKRLWFPQFVLVLLNLINTNLSFQTEKLIIIPLSGVRSIVKDFSPNNLCKPYFGNHYDILQFFFKSDKFLVSL